MYDIGFQLVVDETIHREREKENERKLRRSVL